MGGLPLRQQMRSSGTFLSRGPPDGTEAPPGSPRRRSHSPVAGVFDPALGGQAGARPSGRRRAPPDDRYRINRISTSSAASAQPRSAVRAGTWSRPGQSEAGSIGEREPERGSCWSRRATATQWSSASGSTRRASVSAVAARSSLRCRDGLAGVGQVRKHLGQVDDAEQHQRRPPRRRPPLPPRRGPGRSAPKHREPILRSA